MEAARLHPTYPKGHKRDTGPSRKDAFTLLTSALDGFPAIAYIVRMLAMKPSVRDGAHDPRAIANYILQLSKGSGRKLTIMQLIKLVYLCDGWSMALLGRPMSKHNAQAWQFGPVYPVVYTAFKRFGPAPVTEPAATKATNIPYAEEFSSQEETLMKSVLDNYGKLSAFQLSNLTHQPGTPWSEAYENGVYSDIDPAVMNEHFAKLRDLRAVRGA